MTSAVPPPDESAIGETLPGWEVFFVSPGSPERDLMPPAWLPILDAADPAERVRLALALWNRDLLDALPGYGAALADRTVDVRCCVTDDDPALVYVVRAVRGYVSWVGFDPRTFGEPPPLFDSYPEPLRVFLRDVHAGYVSGSYDTFGPSRPRYLQTLADLADFPEGIPDWEQLSDIPSTRLVSLCTDGGLLHFCASPDLPPGEIALVYEGDVDPSDFGTEFDKMLLSRIED